LKTVSDGAETTDAGSAFHTRDMCRNRRNRLPATSPNMLEIGLKSHYYRAMPHYAIYTPCRLKRLSVRDLVVYDLRTKGNGKVAQTWSLSIDLSCI